MQDFKFTRKRLLIAILLSIVTFLAADTLLFRSGLYCRLLSPVSMTGFGYYVDYYEKHRPSSPTRDILFTGDSRMAEGFSARIANASGTDKSYNFVQASIPGSTLRMWYYLLKDMDPKVSRYRAIVISLPSYREVSPGESALDDYTLDADMLAPILNTRQFIKLVETYPTQSVRDSLWSRVAVTSLNYRMDLQDFLLHPIQRIMSVEWRRRVADRVSDQYNGHPENMEGLSINLKTNELTYPARLSDAERQIVRQRFLKPYDSSPSAFDDYTAEWLGKICARYRGTATELVIVRVPTSPMPQAFNEDSKPVANFVSAIQQCPNVRIVPEETFLNLERPAYFFDTNHLNATGRTEFTKQLVQVIPTILDATKVSISELAGHSFGISKRSTATH